MNVCVQVLGVLSILFARNLRMVLRVVWWLKRIILQKCWAALLAVEDLKQVMGSQGHMWERPQPIVLRLVLGTNC